MSMIQEAFNALDAEKLLSVFEECWDSDLSSLGSKIACWCRKYANDNLGNDEPEVIIPIMSLVLSAWSSYILESKSICYFRQPRESYKYLLEKIYIPKTKSTIIDSRNIAIKQRYIL